MKPKAQPPGSDVGRNRPVAVARRSLHPGHLLALLTDNADYDDLGGDYFVRHGNAARHQDRLVQQFQDLGYHVTLKKVAA